MKYNIADYLNKKILVLDGAMGTHIQKIGLTEQDYSGNNEFKVNQKGNNDLLNITRPEIIRAIHKVYLEAGADIIETNTFNSSRVSQADYGLTDKIYELNFKGARIAREIADEFIRSTPDKPRFVAGSVGPTNKSASISQEVLNPASRSTGFDELSFSYQEQIEGLIDGGADVILIETVFDALNARAAIFGAENAFSNKGNALPLLLSATIADKSGRILSGQTLEAFCLSLRNENVISYGLNCSFGAKDLIPFVEYLSKTQPFYVSFHPNAGLPNALSEYDEKPEITAKYVKLLAAGGNLNIVGGCCGTTHEHIKAIYEAVKDLPPRKIPKIKKETYFCGLEALKVDRGNNFVNIGERSNVSGSLKFARLIKEKKYEEALSVAKEQVENGANIIDINFDDSELDAEYEMENFLKLAASEPEISKVPIMIDSSRFNVLLKGLKSIQGKAIVNSISLKNGEKEFIRQASLVKRFGAGLVIMAFDEKGQADTFERKIEICKRAYDLLVKKVKFPPEDIIFDPNVLAIATGIEAHNDYAVSFIKAVKWIKENLPHAKVSGGVSNLSFSFRGLNQIREAMHSVFLYHAVKAGMDMGIVNAGIIQIYDEIEPSLLEKVEAVVLNKSPKASEELLSFAEGYRTKENEKATETLAWRNLDIKGRLKQSIIKGTTDFLKADIEEAVKTFEKAIDIVEGPLMDGMSSVGELFSDGKMFLPQVVKSARVMKKAVEHLLPFLKSEKSAAAHKSAGKVLFATVKGDVHDIGKNIVSVVLSCNNFEVVDLGVMVPCEEILEAAEREKADIIALSGLITPSLEEMQSVAREMSTRKFGIPLMIGGATTSKLHTALKIAPEYHSVAHTTDASKAVEVAKKLMNKSLRDDFLKQTYDEYEKLKKVREGFNAGLVPIAEAREMRFKSDRNKSIKQPLFTGVKALNDFPLYELRDYIDWNMFFSSWQMKKTFPDIMKHEKYKIVASKLQNDAYIMLDSFVKEKAVTANAAFGIFPAYSLGDDIIIKNGSESTTFNFLRQQAPEDGYCKCLSDYIAPKDSKANDYLGMFLLSTGIGSAEFAKKLGDKDGEYSALMVRILSNVLAESFSRRLFEIVLTDYWGFDRPKQDLPGIRPAFGYSSLFDHSEKEKVFKLLNGRENTGINLTENYMLEPSASICGLYFTSPEAGYFDISSIDEGQLSDYVRRSGKKESLVKKQLGRINII